MAGGFDPDVLGDWVEKGETGGVGAVDVPPGRYLVDVYTYLHSMNGRVIVGDVWAGHDAPSEKLKASVDAGALVVEDPLDWVTFLVHLRPFDAAAALDEREEGDWYGAGQGLRRPAVLPLGVAASGVQDPEVPNELKPLLPRAIAAP